MKTKVKISNYGGSYYDTETGDTVRFSCQYNPIGDQQFPKGGLTVWIKTWDSYGEREVIYGNTRYKWNGYNNAVRKEILTNRELIKEILSLP